MYGTLKWRGAPRVVAIDVDDQQGNTAEACVFL
jgi:hypothetical protein